MADTSERIVVGVDGSPCSVHALRWALRLAEASGAEIEVLLVWTDPWSIVGPPSLIGAGKTGLARLRAMLRERVQEAVRDEAAGNVRIASKVVAGQAAETLVAESRGARMLVVGTTGLSGFRRLMLGSVSQRCAQLSHVPVVIVPLPDEQASAGVLGDAPGATVGASRAREVH